MSSKNNKSEKLEIAHSWGSVGEAIASVLQIVSSVSVRGALTLFKAFTQLPSRCRMIGSSRLDDFSDKGWMGDTEVQ